MRFGIASLVPVAAAILCAQTQQDLPIVRDGRDWVRSTRDIVIPAPRQNLIVNTNMRVVVLGGGDRMTWKLRQRVRAGTEATARSLIGSVPFEGNSSGNTTRLTVLPVTGGYVANELEIHVPSKMAQVAVNTRSGSIEIYDIDGDVQAATYSGLVQMDRIGGNVLQAQTSGGDIRFGKVGGYIGRCSTGAGTVTVGSSGGPVNCATAGGEMAVGQAGGSLTLTSGGGDIHVDKSVGPLHAESAAGMIQVKSGSGPLNIAAMMGGIVAELMAGARLDDSFLSVDSGDITVFIPSNVAVTIVARNSSRGIPQRVISEFPEIRVDANRLFRAPLVAQGAINGGGPVLAIDAGSGAIYLRRAK